MEKLIELFFEFHDYLKLIFVDGAEEVSGVSIVPLFPHQDSNVPFRKEVCEETKSMCIFKTPWVYGIRLNHRLGKKNAHNSVFFLNYANFYMLMLNMKVMDNVYL